jgi:hypothetical protein
VAEPRTWIRGGLLLALLLAPGLLLANGGTLRFLGILDPWEVAVFTDPTPVRPDSLDVSVLVTLPGNPRPVDGLEVAVSIRQPDGGEVRQPATREEADDPRYYAAKFRGMGAGDVEVTVTVVGPEGGGGTATFTVEAREPGALEHPAVLFLLALVPLAGVTWWLRRSRGPGGGTPAAAAPPGE